MSSVRIFSVFCTDSVLANDLPRLGDFTFLDVVMGFLFVIPGFTVVWNVALKRMEYHCREKPARHIDLYTLWIYPVSQRVLVYLA